MGILTPSKDAARVVNLGSSAAANTTLLQAALDASSYVYVRTGGEVNDTLTIGDNTTLELGPGVTITAAMADYMLVNADQVAGNSNITVRGGTWDMNSQTPTGAYPGGWPGHAIFFYQVARLTMRDLDVNNSPKFAIATWDIEHGLFDNIHFATDSDGVHISGPANDITIRDISGVTGDDMVAFTMGNYADYEVAVGNITNVLVDGVHGESGAFAGIKIAGKDTYHIADATIQNITGTWQRQLVGVVDDSPLSGTDFRRLTIRGVKGTSTGANGLVHFNASQGQDVLIEDIATGDTDSRIVYHNSGAVTDRITIRGVKALTSRSAKTLDIDGTVNNLDVEDAHVVVSSDAFLNVRNSATIGRFRARGVTQEGGSYFVFSQGGAIANVKASDMLIDGVTYFARLDVACNLQLSNVTVKDTTYFLWGPAAASAIRAECENVFLEGSGNNLATANGGTIAVNGVKTKVDASKLTPAAGDLVFNTSAGTGGGVGPNVYDGTTWTRLY